MHSFPNFPFNAGEVKGHHLLEFGCGPCVNSIIPACKWFDKITLADYTPSNIAQLYKWIGEEDGVFDWTPYFKYHTELEGKG